jgi:hypothetical protein
MTATLTPAPPRPPATGRTVLRLHRTALIVWVVVVVAASASLLWAYGPGASAAETEWRQNCGGGPYCMWDTTLNPYYRAVRLPELAIAWLHLPVAAWAGAALVGREMENGTARLAWTQGVAPARWLAAKLAVPAALLTAGAGVLVLVHRLTYEANPFPVILRWSEESVFIANGTVAVALPLLALAVGALTGLLLRRTLPALAVGTAVTAAIVMAADAVTPHLWPSKTAVGTLETGYTAPNDVLQGDHGALTSTGARIPDPGCGDNDGGKCLADHDITGYFTDYHPSSHFWPLQLVETGILLALTGMAVAAAFWLLRRRIA